MAGKDDSDEALIKKLRSRGYAVERAGARYQKHSFGTEESVLNAFFKIVKEQKLEIQVAHTEALKEWVERQKEKG